jgi:hypothetical protein
MHSALSIIVLFATLLLAMGIASATPVEQQVGQQTISSPVMKLPSNGGKICYDPDLDVIFHKALARYKHNMGQLANYVLNQIKLVRTSTWFVHAQMIGRQQPHVEWESASNGDIFQAVTHNGCYYHDGVTYLVAVRY